MSYRSPAYENLDDSPVQMPTPAILKFLAGINSRRVSPLEMPTSDMIQAGVDEVVKYVDDFHLYSSREEFAAMIYLVMKDRESPAPAP